MRLSDISDLLQHYQSPDDWLRVNNERQDGGDTLVCHGDVLLCMKFNLVWNDGKPYTRLELIYGTTLLSWTDIPVGPLVDRPAFVEALQALAKSLIS
jgi:hypothetical protein